MNNLHPIFEKIFNDSFPALKDPEICTICGEKEPDCVCERCPSCGVLDVPIMTRAGKECPNCGEAWDELGDAFYLDDNAYFLKTETEALIRDGY